MTDLPAKLFNTCPYVNYLGIDLIEAQGGCALLSLTFDQRLTHPYGQLHGGVTASLVDASVACALLTLVKPEDKVGTIELKVNFLAPVTGGKITAEARVIHQGKKTAVGEVDVRNEEGMLVAKGMATYTIY
ncbi:MAG: PaaI family thioesterase [Deltaproteobacteria bacterium]|nr:MAG: PaaI family thioesterase [Deltaproteobacteria bacterium]